MDEKYAKYLINKTRQNYNLIADDFTRTRAFISQDIERLGDYSFPGEKVLDSGCGSGRLFEVLRKKEVDYYGVDISDKLIQIAKKNHTGAKFQTFDGLDLPFSDKFFDKVYSVSVLHHIPSQKLRLHYLKEAKRVLKNEGLLILRVWDFWKRGIMLKLIFKHTFLKITGSFKLDLKDVFVPWKNPEGKILIERYFHCFTLKEIEVLVKKAGFKIEKAWREGKGSRANIYLVAKKTS